MGTLKLRVTQKGNSYEGMVSINGLQPTKLVKNDGGTNYATRSGASQAAQNLARKMNLTYKEEATPVAKAAKKSTKKNSPTCHGFSW